MGILSKLFRKRDRESAPIGEPLTIVPIPPLVTVLTFKEQAKGSALTEAEVLLVRDKAICMALPASEAAALEQARGYRDISLDHPWEEWSAVRHEQMGAEE